MGMLGVTPDRMGCGNVGGHLTGCGNAGGT